MITPETRATRWVAVKSAITEAKESTKTQEKLKTCISTLKSALGDEIAL
jgi:hypothetical protein